MTSHPPARWRLRAFTLVELLVVIGIIALLISVLLPALGRAREQAKAATCLSNVKQIATAIQMYAHDHKIFIYFQAGIDRKVMLYPYLRQGQNNADNRPMSVWNCPSNMTIDTEASYGINSKFNGTAGARTKYSSIRRPSEKVALADAGLLDNGQSSTATHVMSPGTASNATNCRPNYLRHPKQMVMVGFIDGHAEPMPMKPPFYPGILGTPGLFNGIVDPADSNFLDKMWVKE